MSGMIGLMAKHGRPLIERLEANTVTDPDSGCKIWQGAKGGQSGYGQIRIGSLKDGTRRMEYVHRIAWMLTFGPIPADREIDHVKALGCKDNRCWNIDHLQAVPHQVNAKRRGHPCAGNECLYHGPGDANNFHRTERNE